MPRRDLPVLILIFMGSCVFVKLAFHTYNNKITTEQIKLQGISYAPFEDDLYNEEEYINTNDRLDISALARAPITRERLKKLLKCNDRLLQFEKLQYGNYWLLRNYIRGAISRVVGCADTITLATNGDYAFFNSLPFLVQRWQAPISFTLYTPGYDFNDTLSCIQYLRNCVPESQHIRDYVTFHMFFPVTRIPEYVPFTEAEALSWPYDCAEPAPYLNVDRAKMFKSIKNMTYPINVARNIARKSVNTHFIFSSDVELFPTPDLPSLFLDLVERNLTVYLHRHSPRVYTLPVFEVTADSQVPANKHDLVQMLRNRTAITFHANICDTCHMVPKHNEWINASDANELTLFSHTKREFTYCYWEPFYISDNEEPIFDERITWEGQSNKRIQNYAMCLLSYDYYVLHPAFLVHTPGIKYYERNATRLQYVPATNKLIKEVIEPEYHILYGENVNCRT